MKTTTTETSIPEEKTTSARIQAYSKSQLAALYLPHIQPASARRTLRSWIAKNTELQAALARSGYTGKRPAQPYHVPFLTKNNIPNPDRTAVHLRVGNIFISQCTDLRTSKPASTSIFPAEDYTKFSQYLSYLNSSSIFLRSLSPTGSFSPFLNTVTSFLNLISIKNFLFPSR